MIERLVRVVAGDTADARVVADEAPAVLETVRLKAHKCRTVPFVAHHGVPGAVTLSAEVRDLLGIEMLQRSGKRFEVFLRGIGHVLLRAGMTVFAFKAGNHLCWIEFLSRGNAAAVAVEAGAGFPEGQLAPHGLGEIVRGDLLVARRDGEAVRAREVTDEALVVVAVLLEYPCLRVLAEDPMDGECHGFGPVGNRVGALAVFGLHLVGVRADLDAEVAVRVQCRVCALRLHRVAHRRDCEGGGHAVVTGCASDR